MAPPPPSPTKPVALTIGQSLAHVSRAKIWAIAVLSSLMFPAIVGGILYLNLHIFPACRPWSFLTSVLWRLALLLAWCAYLSVPRLVRSYAELYLPRTPVAVAEKMVIVGFWGVGVTGLGLMVGLVLGLRVKDTRVLAACTAVPAAFVVGLVAFGVWLARTYGGDGDGDGDAAVSELESSAVERLPV